jgi:hypothetical protein
VAPVVWVDIGTRPEHDPVDHDRPGLDRASLGAPSGSCGLGPDPPFSLAEITVLAVLSTPATWQDLVAFCVELQEMAAAGWMVVLDGAGAEAVADGAVVAHNGVGPVPAHVPAWMPKKGRPRREAARLVSDSHSAVGRDSQGLSTTVSTMVYVSDSDSSTVQMARCNGPLHEGAWLPLDQFTLVKRQEGADRRFRADGARKPRSVCKACHALIQRQRYGEQRKAYMDTWRAARKASGRVVFKYSQDSSRGADSSRSTKRRA